MELPYARASPEAEALKTGIRIRDEIERQLSSEAAMHQP
jgi:hypothetical protein